MLGPIDDWEVQIWKCVGGFYSLATEREMAFPNFIPIIAFVKQWSESHSVNMIYEDHNLYFVYTDALTTEQVKEPVELRDWQGNYHKLLLEEAEKILAKHFSKEK